MCSIMKENFDKYWSEYNVVLAFGAILDPTEKLNFLKYTYSKLDPYGYEEILYKVKKPLYALFEEHRNKGASTNLTSFFIIWINHQVLLEKKGRRRSCLHMM